MPREDYFKGLERFRKRMSDISEGIVKIRQCSTPVHITVIIAYSPTNLPTKQMGNDWGEFYHDLQDILMPYLKQI